MRLPLIFMGFFFSLRIYAAGIYVSPSGSDSGNGTFANPYRTIAKAVSVLAVKDTAFVRGGTYLISSTVNLSKKGTSSGKYFLFSYQNERPLLDCTPTSTGTRGISVSGAYWHLKGLDVKGAGDNGMNISGSNNIVEFCSFFENEDTGLQLGGGASNNQIINCDSYYNVDAGQGNADGFSPKLDVGTGNYFYGCRSWQNSDDGWDGYMRPSDNMSTVIENCWTFMNGYLKNGTKSLGNGNGFKMGGGDNGNADSLRHHMILKNCLSFDNLVKGYDQNNNRGSMTLLNCTAFRNGINFRINAGLGSGSILTVKNCLSAGTAAVQLLSYAVTAKNSWDPEFSVTTADFISMDTAGVRGARKADGSLPDVPFMHLAPGSDLIDAGVDVGLPYTGTAPDLGCFETQKPSFVINENDIPGNYSLLTNYPNPFNPSTTIRFSVGKSRKVSVSVYDLLGQKIASLFAGELVQGKIYDREFNASGFPGGIYFVRLEGEGKTAVQKLVLMR